MRSDAKGIVLNYNSYQIPNGRFRWFSSCESQLRTSRSRHDNTPGYRRLPAFEFHRVDALTCFSSRIQFATIDEMPCFLYFSISCSLFSSRARPEPMRFTKLHSIFIYLCLYLHINQSTQKRIDRKRKCSWLVSHTNRMHIKYTTLYILQVQHKQCC